MGNEKQGKIITNYQEFLIWWNPKAGRNRLCRFSRNPGWKRVLPVDTHEVAV